MYPEKILIKRFFERKEANVYTFVHITLYVYTIISLIYIVTCKAQRILQFIIPTKEETVSQKINNLLKH